MKLQNKIAVIANNLDTFDVDCAITVALKITDDTCKMDEQQKALFMHLYDALIEPKSALFDESVFDLIEIGRNDASSFVFEEIKILREMAMNEIGRPHMKNFKAMVRRLLQE
ncbi:MAG: hypothetical protein U9N52_09555 [Campylobacterota bacterium]|nr:hypothetical protein [Campylobacterota bacterium]